jgi:predicted TIM-barrel fold metal-dependent hydrolase
MDWLWPAPERDGHPVSLFAFDSRTVVGQIAQRHPGLRLLVDHLGGRGGMGATKVAAALAHLPKLLAQARYPNVAVKATGVPGSSSEPDPYRNLQPYLRRIDDAFGPERLF